MEARIRIIDAEKRCSNCAEFKPHFEFHRDKTKKMGISQRCKDCTKEHKRRIYINNKDKYKERNHNYYIAHKVIRVDVLAGIED